MLLFVTVLLLFAFPVYDTFVHIFMRVEHWRVGILAYRWCKGSSIALSMLKLVLHQPNSSLGTLWTSIEAFMFTWSNLRRVRMIPKVRDWYTKVRDTNYRDWYDEMLAKQALLLRTAARLQKEADRSHISGLIPGLPTEFAIGAYVLAKYPPTAM
eukprot:scaffold12031_cov221-Ochromonas_danica.AAC.1